MTHEEVSPMDSTTIPETPHEARLSDDEQHARFARHSLLCIARRVEDGSEAHLLAVTAVAAVDDLLEVIA